MAAAPATTTSRSTAVFDAPGPAGRPSEWQVHETASRLRNEFTDPASWRELVQDLRAMAAGSDMGGRREREFEGWSDGDFDRLLALLGRRP